jgi:hypothetical protein
MRRASRFKNPGYALDAFLGALAHTSQQFAEMVSS